MRRLPVLALAVLGSIPLLAGGCLPEQRSPIGAASPSPVVSGQRSPSPTGSPSDGYSPFEQPTVSAVAAVPSVAGSSAPEPQLVVRSAVAALEGTSFRFTLGDDSRRAEGVYDPTTRAVSLSRVADGRTTTVFVSGGELLLSGLAPDGTVLKFETSRLPANHSLLPAAIPLLPVCLLTGARKLEPHDDGYVGKIDLSKVDVLRLGEASSAVLTRYVAYLAKQAGDRANDVGFMVTIDSAGRVAGFRATFPRADNGRDLEYEFTVIAPGTRAAATRPVGSVVEAPPAAYQP